MLKGASGKQGPMGLPGSQGMKVSLNEACRYHLKILVEYRL